MSDGLTWGATPGSTSGGIGSLGSLAQNQTSVGHSIGQVATFQRMAQDLYRSQTQAMNDILAAGAPVASVQKPIQENAIGSAEEYNLKMKAYFSKLPPQYSTNETLKQIHDDAVKQGLKVSNPPTIAGADLFSASASNKAVTDYIAKINGMNKTTYYAVTDQLTTLYKEYLKEGGKPGSVTAPKDYGTTVTDSKIASSIVTTYLETLNKALGRDLKSTTTTNYYDLDKSITSLLSAFKAAGGNVQALGKIPTYGTSVTDEAKAKGILDDLENRMNKLLPTQVIYDPGATMTTLYNSLLAQGYGNVLKPPTAGNTSSASDAQKIVDDYVKQLNNSNLLDPSSHLNDLILNGVPQSQIDALARTAGWRSNIDPQKTSGLQFVLKLDPVETQRYLDAKAANVGLSEYDWRASHDQNTLTTKGTFTPLTYQDATRDSSRNGSGNKSALDNPAVKAIIDENEAISRVLGTSANSFLASSLSTTTTTTAPKVVGAGTNLTPSAVTDINKITTGAGIKAVETLQNIFLANDLITNINKLNPSDMSLTPKLDAIKATQDLERSIGIRKIATDNAAVAKIMADNSHLTTSQIFDKSNGITPTARTPSSSAPGSSMTGDLSFAMDDFNRVFNDILSPSGKVDKVLDSYQSALKNWDANLKPYNPQNEVSGTENPYAIDKESELDAINFNQPVLNVVSDILKDAGKAANYTLKSFGADTAKADQTLSPLTSKIPTANDLGISGTVSSAIDNISIIPGLNVVSDIISQFSSSSIGKTIIADIENTGILNNPVITRLENNLKVIDDIVKPLQTVSSGVGNYVANSWDYMRLHPGTAAANALVTAGVGLLTGGAVEAAIGGMEVVSDILTPFATNLVRPAVMAGMTGQLTAQAALTLEQGDIGKDMDFITNLIVGGIGYGEGGKFGDEAVTKISDKVSDISGKIKDSYNPEPLTSRNGDLYGKDLQLKAQLDNVKDVRLTYPTKDEQVLKLQADVRRLQSSYNKTGDLETLRNLKTAQKTVDAYTLRSENAALLKSPLASKSYGDMIFDKQLKDLKVITDVADEYSEAMKIPNKMDEVHQTLRVIAQDAQDVQEILNKEEFAKEYMQPTIHQDVTSKSEFDAETSRLRVEKGANDEFNPDMNKALTLIQRGMDSVKEIEDGMKEPKGEVTYTKEELKALHDKRNAEIKEQRNSKNSRVDNKEVTKDSSLKDFYRPEGLDTYDEIKLKDSLKPIDEIHTTFEKVLSEQQKIYEDAKFKEWEKSQLDKLAKREDRDLAKTENGYDEAHSKAWEDSQINRMLKREGKQSEIYITHEKTSSILKSLDELMAEWDKAEGTIRETSTTFRPHEFEEVFRAVEKPPEKVSLTTTTASKFKNHGKAFDEESRKSQSSNQNTINHSNGLQSILKVQNEIDTIVKEKSEEKPVTKSEETKTEEKVQNKKIKNEVKTSEPDASFNRNAIGDYAEEPEGQTKYHMGSSPSFNNSMSGITQDHNTISGLITNFQQYQNQVPQINTAPSISTQIKPILKDMAIVSTVVGNINATPVKPVIGTSPVIGSAVTSGTVSSQGVTPLPLREVPVIQAITGELTTVNNIVPSPGKKNHPPIVPPTQKQINDYAAREVKKINASRLIINQLGTLF